MKTLIEWKYCKDLAIPLRDIEMCSLCDSNLCEEIKTYLGVFSILKFFSNSILLYTFICKIHCFFLSSKNTLRILMTVPDASAE